MITDTPFSGIPEELLTEMQEAARLALSPSRDPEVMREACERMDRMREDVYKKHGLLDIGVPSIRELRESESRLL